MEEYNIGEIVHVNWADEANNHANSFIIYAGKPNDNRVSFAVRNSGNYSPTYNTFHNYCSAETIKYIDIPESKNHCFKIDRIKDDKITLEVILKKDK